MEVSSFTIKKSMIRQLLFCGFVLFCFIGLTPLTESSLTTELDYASSNVLRQIIIFVFFALSFLSFKSSNKTRLEIPIGLKLLAGWILLSVVWSAYPTTSFKRVVLLFLIVASVFFFVSSLTIKEAIKSLVWSFVFLITVSALLVIVNPAAIHSGYDLLDQNLVGAWKGIFQHKNHAGPACVFAIAIFTYAYKKNRDNRFAALVALSIVFLFFTKAKTSIILAVPSLLAGYYLASANIERIKKSILIFSLVICSLVLFLKLNDGLLDILMEPRFLSGRVAIWSMVLEYTRDNVFFGSGYGAIWRVAEDSPLTPYGDFRTAWIFSLTHSHSGYIEALSSLGLVGLILTVWVFVIVPLRYLIITNGSDKKLSELLGGILIFLCIHNFMETDWFNSNDGRWVVYLITYFLILKVYQSRRI